MVSRIVILMAAKAILSHESDRVKEINLLLNSNGTPGCSEYFSPFSKKRAYFLAQISYCNGVVNLRIMFRSGKFGGFTARIVGSSEPFFIKEYARWRA